MSLDFENFLSFTKALRISTKERGMLTLGDNLLGTQGMLFDQIQQGLQDGIHEFVVLKARQLGISSALLAWDMYYAFRYPGISGAIVTHDEPAREQFRATLELYYAGLPDEWKQDIPQHNRNQIVFANRSMLQYKVAGLIETSKKVLGRSSAISYGHMTECAYWGDPSQIKSLKSSMAQQNPMRFFVWESTANGFNHWYEMWEDAKASSSVRPIFIGWWAHDYYRVKRDGRVWRQYWGKKGKLTAAERERIERVKADYDVELTDEQIAWYRFELAEHMGGDEMAMCAEYPSLPDEAFVATGSKYFTGASMTKAYQIVLGEPKCQSFRVEFGQEFAETNLAEVNDARATLRVYEEPDPKGFYVLGADPAYGSSDDADRFAATVLRAYANRLEQVAEFCTTDLSPYTFAWVIVLLAGAYRPCLYNIELNGSGTAVFQEIDNLRRAANRSVLPGAERSAPNPLLKDVTRKISDFLYAREDSITGRPQGKHTITTERVKETYMALMKDNFERGILTVHSRFLLDEMKSVVRDGGSISAEGDAHDDRVIATALAVKAWQDQLRSMLIQRNVIYIPPQLRTKDEPPAETVLGRSVRNYLQAYGVLPKPVNPNSGVRTYIPQPRR